MYCRHEACKVRYRLVGFRTSRLVLTGSPVLSINQQGLSAVSVADLTCTCHLEFIVHCPRRLQVQGTPRRRLPLERRGKRAAQVRCAQRITQRGGHTSESQIFFLEDTVTAQSAKQTGFVNCQIVPWAISVGAAASFPHSPHAQFYVGS